MNAKGQSAVEALAVLPLLIGLFIFVCGACYAVFARAWLGYQMDQALFCAVEVNNRRDCRESAHAAMLRYLPWGRLRFELNEETPRAEVDWTWRDGRFHREKILKLDPRSWR